VNAGVDQILCGNNATATLSAASPLRHRRAVVRRHGSLRPGSTAQNITYYAFADRSRQRLRDLIATTTGNGLCNAVSDQVQMNYTAAPVANAGPDQTVSSNNPTTTLAGSFSVAHGAAAGAVVQELTVRTTPP
jgi:hypothetical protein